MILEILTLITLTTNFSAAEPTKKDTLKYKSYTSYKQGLIEYNKQDYEKAAEYLEKSLELYANNKKSRELLVKIRQTGLEYYKTGVSLIHFNKKLAEDYLNKAMALTDPDDEKTRDKITAALESLSSD